MENACTTLAEVMRSTRQFKINGFSMTWGMSRDSYGKSRWNVGGYDWEIRIYPHAGKASALSSVALHLIFLSEEARAFGVRTTITGCLVDPEAILKPSMAICRSATFRKPQDSSSEVFLMPGYELEASPYIKDDSFTVQCTLEVLKELPDIPQVHIPVPPSNLHQHFAELLWNEMGADVTFLVSGESFAAHKHILAVRSPVFKAAFLGDMIEKGSPSLEIKDMEVTVFKGLLHFIYTDSVPAFEQREEAEAITLMAQHLLAAADRYGLDRLKLICAGELSGGINVETAATTLALAEQHNCLELKTECVDYITTTSATLDAVLATEGYKHLEASCPLAVIDLLRSARGSKI